jgi:poly(ADP-ribose) glycohydrolase
MTAINTGDTMTSLGFLVTGAASVCLPVPDQVVDICRRISEAADLEQLRVVMSSYSQVDTPVTLAGLQQSLQHLESSDLVRNHFFDVLLPHIASRASQIALMFPSGVPLLNGIIVLQMSRAQVACILANMFLQLVEAPPGDYNAGNMMYWLEDAKFPSDIAKLQMVLHYFERLVVMEPDTPADARTYTSPEGSIIFRRTSAGESIDFRSSTVPLCNASVHVEGSLDDAEGALHADFANEYIGGGVLHSGAVQEEILFCVNPEHLVTCLLAERMSPSEAIIITGTEKFSKSLGYARTLQFGGSYLDTTPFMEVHLHGDAMGPPVRLLARSTVAIDATLFQYRNFRRQMHKSTVDREIRKAFAGFSCAGPEVDSFKSVATGKWGCGAFNGSVPLKAIIQWIAVSLGQRSMQFYTFGDATFASSFSELITFCLELHATAGELYTALGKFESEMLKDEDLDEEHLFPFIKTWLCTLREGAIA